MNDMEKYQPLTSENDPSFDPEREKKKARRKRVFSRFAKVLTGFVVVSLTATEAMMFIMFGRTDPMLQSPFGILGWAQERNYRAQTLEFMSGDNRIRGYVVAPPAPKALMLIVHGVRSSSDALEPIAKYFVNRSYAVMTFDGTASGRSEGKNTVGLQQQRYDIRAALDYIRQDPVLSSYPLVMLGHSAGAYGVAVEAPRSGAAAAVCISGFESPLGTMRFWAEHYAGALTNVEYPFLWIREYAAKGSDANESGAQAIAGSDVPMLVVHGSRDEVIALEISLYRAVLEQRPLWAEPVLVTDERFNMHSNILVSEGVLNRDLLMKISGFLDARISARG